MTFGSSIVVKVVATNVKGSSAESLTGNGATIITVPDAPISLVEDLSSRTISTLGLNWSDGLSDGGSAIIDYRVSMAVSGAEYSEMGTVTSKSFVATSLTFGVSYDFKVEARNQFGYSSFSDSITILCATVPDAPTSVTTLFETTSVKVSWNF